MAQNNTPRRRRAFSDFKENQYDDSFSLSPKQKRKIAALEAIKWAAIIITAAIFIALGFILTDSLMDISEQPYEDNNTYTASFSKTSQTSESTSQTDSGETNENSQSDNSEPEEGTDKQTETLDNTLEQ